MNSNKLIAEFMGLETPDGCYFEYLTKDGERSKLTHFMLLEYHLSWDWLMPVVIKIGGGSNILGAMRVLRPYSFIRNLEDVYEAVVEFIKNQNN